MNRIILKKEIKAKYPVEGISLVNLEDEIEYKSSSEGMYATGSIKISGEYYKGVRNSKFLDEIDVDIFAPFDDLSSRNELHINIIDFDYKINEDMLLFEVILDVDGLKEMNKSFPSEVYEENEEVLPIENIEKVDEATIVEKNEINEDIKKIVLLLEKEFNKMLTPLELETVYKWINDDKFSYDKIYEAVLETLKYKKNSIQYVDVLLNKKETPVKSSSNDGLQDLFNQVYGKIK